MIRIIFSDMDGTLLTSENKLPEGFDEMITELHRRGVTFAPASGRQYFSLLRSFKKYSDDFLFLAENGAFVVKNGKEIFSSPLNVEATKQVLAATEGVDNIFRVWCGKKDAYLRREQDIPEFRAELEKYYTRSRVVDNFSDIRDVPLKVAFFDPTAHAAENIYPKLEPFKSSLQVVLSSDYWVDVMSPVVSKGEAIKNIQRVMGFRPDECAAFGDYLNDCEMMQSVGYGFAMANAHPDLKKFAKFETLSNDMGGVLAGIRRLMFERLI